MITGQATRYKVQAACQYACCGLLCAHCFQAGIFKQVARRLNALRERTLALCFGLWRDYAEAKKAREMKKVRGGCVGGSLISQSARDLPQCTCPTLAHHTYNTCLGQPAAHTTKERPFRTPLQPEIPVTAHHAN